MASRSSGLYWSVVGGLYWSVVGGSLCLGFFAVPINMPVFWFDLVGLAASSYSGNERLSYGKRRPAKRYGREQKNGLLKNSGPAKGLISELAAPDSAGAGVHEYRYIAATAGRFKRIGAAVALNSGNISKATVAHYPSGFTARETAIAIIVMRD